MTQNRLSNLHLRHQYDEQQQQNHQQHHQDDHYHDNDHHHDNRNTVPGVSYTLPPTEAMELIGKAYRENIGPQITAAVARMIEDALRSGMDVDTVVMAIEETGLAPRPSAFYLRAVLKNWAMEGAAYSRVRNTTQPIECERWWTVTAADVHRRQRSPAMSEDEIGPI